MSNCLIDDLPPLREVIRKHDLRAEKKLGQNFLLDLNLTDKIARSAGDLSGCIVFEIGPGPGGLTRALLKTQAQHVIALEYDRRAIEALYDLEKVAQGRLSVLHQDALEAKLLSLTNQRPVAVVANLPYNIATPLLIRWLESVYENPAVYQSFTLMFQKEVADRLISKPSSKSYGRLSVMAQWLCTVKKLFDVPASAFTPAPKVTSSIVHLIPKSDFDSDVGFQDLETITKAAFNQRRKMLRSSLSDYADALEKSGIDPTLRAENLSVEDYIAITRCLP